MQLLEEYGMGEKPIRNLKELSLAMKEMREKYSKKHQTTVPQKDPNDYAKRIFELVNEWVKNPTTLYESDIDVLVAMKALGIDEQRVIDIIIKHENGFITKISDIVGDISDDYDNIYFKYLPELKDKNPSVYLIYKGHSCLVYSKKRKKFVSCDRSFLGSIINNMTPYKYIELVSSDAEEDYFRKAAKQLGYLK